MRLKIERELFNCHYPGVELTPPGGFLVVKPPAIIPSLPSRKVKIANVFLHPANFFTILRKEDGGVIIGNFFFNLLLQLGDDFCLEEGPKIPLSLPLPKKEDIPASDDSNYTVKLRLENKTFSWELLKKTETTLQFSCRIRADLQVTIWGIGEIELLLPESLADLQREIAYLKGNSAEKLVLKIKQEIDVLENRLSLLEQKLQELTAKISTHNEPTVITFPQHPPENSKKSLVWHFLKSRPG